MNRDRFHNQLALNIGYKLIKDKRYTLLVEDSDDPWITLKVKGYGDIRFKASSGTKQVNCGVESEMREEINGIIEASQMAFIQASNYRF